MDFKKIKLTPEMIAYLEKVEQEHAEIVRTLKLETGRMIDAAIVKRIIEIAGTFDMQDAAENAHSYILPDRTLVRYRGKVIVECMHPRFDDKTCAVIVREVYEK